MGKILEPFEKGRVKLSEELIVEDVQTAECDFRISENTCGNKGKKRNQGDGTHQGKVGDDDRIIAALVLRKPPEGFFYDLENYKVFQFFTG